MKKLILLISLISVNVFAADKFEFSFANAELGDVIAQYSKLTGQKFVIDPGVRGRVNIVNQKKISAEEAFNDLSIQLAVNGYAMMKQNDGYRVETARDVSKKVSEVSTTLPSLNPERLVTWVYTAKNLKLKDLMNFLRVEMSKYGSININESSNQLVFTDFTSTIHRMSEILKKTDVQPEK